METGKSRVSSDASMIVGCHSSGGGSERSSICSIAAAAAAGVKLRLNTKPQ